MEYGDADIMLVTPGFTNTNMCKGPNYALNMADSPANCAASALRDLGYEKVTPGTLAADLSE